MESAGDCENIRMKRLFKRITALASAAALMLSLAACGGSAVSGPKNTAPTNAKPVTITVWSYYNGDQLETFSKLVDEFNATVGKEQNITVEASSQGSVNDLETNVLAAAEGKVGAAEMPNIFSAYADTCYAVDQMGLVADLSGYLTDEEKRRSRRAISPRATLTTAAPSKFSRWQNPPSCCSSMIPIGRPLRRPQGQRMRTFPPWRAL